MLVSSRLSLRFAPISNAVWFVLPIVGMGVLSAKADYVSYTGELDNSIIGETTVEANLNYGNNLDFVYGFNDSTGSGGISLATPTVTPLGNGWNFSYSDTAYSATGGASATANMSIDWGPHNGYAGFYNFNVSLTQSNPNNIPIGEAELIFGDGTGVDDTYDAFDPTDVTAVLPYTSQVLLTGTVGNNIGDFVRFTGFTDEPVADYTLGTQLNDDAVTSGLESLAAGEAEQFHYYNYEVEVEDPGGTATASVIGSVSGAVPEPAAFALGAASLGVVGLRRRQRDVATN